MAAKPRLTVRLAPSYLHALAYIAERHGSAPAEVAREMMGAQISQVLGDNVWRRDWEACYRAWQAEQGGKPGRAESPEQADYDALAAGQVSPTSPALRRDVRDIPTPPSRTIAEGQGLIGRIRAAQASGTPRR